ncbi:MAG: helix-turn-helix transcriptional regulator [FCB group bacterium]
MKLTERLKIFIENNYKTQKEFAEKANIDITALNRYLSGKVSPGVDVLNKFNIAGVSIDWLINGTGSMYAKNPKGYELSNHTEIQEIIDTSTPYKRIIKWINENYGSLNNFALLMDINLEDLKNTLYENVVPDLSFITILNRSGCNTDWILTCEGSMYANNPIGEILKSKQYVTMLNQGELLNEVNQEMDNAKLEFFEDLINKLRLAIRAEFNEKSKSQIEDKHENKE